MKSTLRQIAHARTGDKGDASMISLIAYRPELFGVLRDQVTVAQVGAHFTDLAATSIERFELPKLGALNFVLYGVLAGGVTRSLALDSHGKTLGSCLLEMEIDLPDDAGEG